jgi:hypothetical protein
MMMVWIGDGSESESSAEPRTFNILVDVFRADWLLHDLADTEGRVPGGIEVLGPDVEGALLLSPLFDLAELHRGGVTSLFLSPSATLTMWPKDGTTLMLMLLPKGMVTRPRRWCSGMTYENNITNKK